jgi:hypothetical protein
VPVVAVKIPQPFAQVEQPVRPVAVKKEPLHARIVMPKRESGSGTQPKVALSPPIRPKFPPEATLAVVKVCP